MSSSPDALVRALEELIACKDLKEAVLGKKKMTAETEGWRLDYERRQPLAWEAARAALAAYRKAEGR